MKKIITVLCLAGLIVSFTGCGKGEEKKPAPSSTPDAVESVEEGIENGGEIDDEGNIVKEDETKEIEAAESTETTVNPGTTVEGGEKKAAPKQEEVLELEYDEKGNITKQSAVKVLQQYTSEQLGLTPDIEHQLLFDTTSTEINGKECYTIAAKIPNANTEGVFYVSFDGKDAYKYDIDNQQYIKLP